LLRRRRERFLPIPICHRPTVTVHGLRLRRRASHARRGRAGGAGQLHEIVMEDPGAKIRMCVVGRPAPVMQWMDTGDRDHDMGPFRSFGTPGAVLKVVS